MSYGAPIFKEIEFSLQVIRADGTVEDLGVTDTLKLTEEEGESIGDLFGEWRPSAAVGSDDRIDAIAG